VATTDEITMGLNWLTAKSPMITSTAKSAPPMGALNVAAMPAAAPQPTMVRRWRGGARRIWPMVEPMAEPICTIGPSRPTDPPEPMVTAEATVRTATVRDRMTPPRTAAASITSGTPCPLASRGNSVTRGPTIRPPRAGIRSRAYQGRLRAASRGSWASASQLSSKNWATPSMPPKNREVKKRMRMRNRMAANAPATPQATATRTMKSRLSKRDRGRR